MQLSSITTATPAAPASQGPADRFRAALNLVFLPNSLHDIVERGAAAAAAAGRAIAPADLVRPYLAQVSAEATRAALLDAVTGALRVAPEFEPRRADLASAAQGVGELLAASAADHVTGAAWDIADRITGALDAVATPLYDVSFDLDPSNG
ncbi:MAG: hypothetical protein JWN72_2195 [Thermoleophilia bacterium]|nr:hypothetical protein [Thermoleophilia bacterium]